VILTLLPAIDLPVDLKVIKNNLGIPHQLPPRFENACLDFGKFDTCCHITITEIKITGFRGQLPNPL
jgi:hypothetical protein